MKKSHILVLVLFTFLSLNGNKLFAQPFAHDLGVIALLSPVSGCYLGHNEHITVQIANFGTDTTYNFGINYMVDGVMQASEFFYAIIAPGDSLIYTFNQLYNFDLPVVYSISIILDDDDNSANNWMSYNILNPPSISSFPYLESFENPSCWSIENAGQYNDWEWGIPSQTTIDSAHSGIKAWMTGLNINYHNNSDCYLISPPFNLQSLSNPRLSVWLNIRTQTDYDGMILEYSNNFGMWQKIEGDPGFYNNISTLGNLTPPKWSGNTFGWTQFTTSLPVCLAYAYHVQFRFRFVSDSSTYDEGIAIDDFSISDDRPDLWLYSINEPISSCSQASPTHVSIKLKNIGIQPAFGFLLDIKVGNDTPIHEYHFDTLIPGQDKYVTSFGLMSLTANFPNQIKVWVTNFLELNHSNDTVFATIYHTLPLSNPPLQINFGSTLDFQHFGLQKGVQSQGLVLNGIGVNGTAALKMTGGLAGSWPPGGGTSTTYNEAFSYLDHIATLYSCNISIAGAVTWALYFDLKQTFSEGPKTSWLRVVKDDYLTLPEMFTADTVLNPTTAMNDPFVPRYYLLSSFTSPFRLSIQTANRLSDFNSPTLTGDNAIIENLQINFFEGIGNTAELSMAIYPNPTKDFLNITLSKTIENGITEIRNMQGQMLICSPINGTKQFTLDARSLQAGVYSLVVKNNDMVQTIKFVKTK